MARFNLDFDAEKIRKISPQSPDKLDDNGSYSGRTETKAVDSVPYFHDFSSGEKEGDTQSNSNFSFNISYNSATLDGERKPIDAAIGFSGYSANEEEAVAEKGYNVSIDFGYRNGRYNEKWDIHAKPDDAHNWLLDILKSGYIGEIRYRLFEDGLWGFTIIEPGRRTIWTDDDLSGYGHEEVQAHEVLHQMQPHTSETGIRRSISEMMPGQRYQL